MTLDEAQQIFPETFVKQLTEISINGNFGDIIMNKNAPAIVKYFKETNPEVTIYIDSNGGGGSKTFWQQLARLGCTVRFSIDGLEDTNHLYRVNVQWERLVKNAQAFIEAGGNAHWDMLVYQHNQHQVDECEQLARDMGFKWFRVKVSRRSFTDRLLAPLGWQTPQVNQGHIECRALAEQSLYIDAQGRASPCCWLGSRQSDFIDDFEKIQLFWSTNPDPVCAATCTTNGQGSSFINQWQREVALC
jgi:sulfatase maturation enzyme AslB (radical SAM superfamily)